MARKVDPEQQALRREELLKATYQVLLSKPSKDVTLEDIALRAGVSKGVTVYYFKTKEEIFRACWTWLISRIGSRMKARAQAAPDPVQALAAVVDTVFVGPSELRDFYTIYVDFLSQGVRNPSFGQVNIEFYALCREVNQAIVTEGIRQGCFREVDLAEAAAFGRAVIDGMCLQMLFDPNPAAFETYRNHCLNALLAYLMPAPPTESQPADSLRKDVSS
ncbi:HTH-type transcriptional regulator BetI [compost metagenome]